MVGIPIGIVIGFVGWFMLRYRDEFLHRQPERTCREDQFWPGTARGKNNVASSMAEALRPDERERYAIKLRDPPLAGISALWPERVYKVSVATETVNMAQDLKT